MSKLDAEGMRVTGAAQDYSRQAQRRWRRELNAAKKRVQEKEKERRRRRYNQMQDIPTWHQTESVRLAQTVLASAWCSAPEESAKKVTGEGVDASEKQNEEEEELG